MKTQIYCINLPKSTDRHDRMIQRFTFHKLINNVTFIEAVDKNSSQVDFYLTDFDSYPIDDKVRGEAACFASHLKAIKTFLQERPNDKGAIICEDDILLHNDFKSLVTKLFKHVPKDAPLVSLGYLVYYWYGFKWINSAENLCQIIPDLVWGTQMYWISRKYALQVIDNFDQPFWKFTGFRTSELITRFSNGYICYPPMVIEEAIDSHIRKTDDMSHHYQLNAKWGYQNYSVAEKEHLSPLAKLS